MMTPALGDRLQFLINNVYPAGGEPYSQAKIAELASTPKAKVTPQQINGIVGGKTKSPSFRTIAALADFFNVPLDYFWIDDDKQWEDYHRWIIRMRERMDSTEMFAARTSRWHQIRAERLAKKDK